MKKLLTCTILALSLAGATAYANDKKHHDGPPAGGMSATVEAQATVTAIDQATRMVTVKGPEGKEVTLHVDERARNLDQVKVGDVIKVVYTEALAWKMSKSKKHEPTADVEAAAARASKGEKPAGAAGRRITITAKIEAIDLDKGTVTLSGPQGNTRTIKARHPENLKKVKVGDLIDITYTEAVSIKVEPAPAK